MTQSRVVSIFDRKEQAIIGTGVLIQSNIILTCHHVVTSKKSISVQIYYPHKIIRIKAHTFYRCKSLDFALMEIDEHFEYLELGDSNKILAGGKARIMCLHEKKPVKDVVYCDPDVTRMFDEPLEQHSILAKGDPCHDGSSGSPFLDEDDNVMALHHGGGIHATTNKFAYGIPINLIKVKLVKAFADWDGVNL